MYGLVTAGSMKLSRQEEFGLRCLMQVGQHAAIASDPPLSIERIASVEGLGYEHTAKIMRLLGRAKLVRSTRGAQGGFHLARTADAISIWDALVALDPPLYQENFCEAFAGQMDSCSHASSACNLKNLWQWVGTTLQAGLSQVSLADLMAGRAPVMQGAAK